MKRMLTVVAALIGYGMACAYAATVFTPVSTNNTPLFTATNPGAVNVLHCQQ